MDTITRGRHPGRCRLRVSLLRHGVLSAAALAATVVLTGCLRDLSSLATRDSFLGSPSASAEQVELETGATIDSLKGLLEIQRACGATSSPDELRERPGTACQVRPVGFHGRMSEAYRRWVEDRVRELPAPSDTASSAGG